MNSFLQGKKILSIAPLRPLAAGMASLKPAAAPAYNAARASGHAAEGHGHPSVEVIKEGDKVVRLVVVCSCGERVEIECLYPGG